MCLYSCHVYFILSDKSENCISDRNERLNLWSQLINWGTQFLIPADWTLRMTCARPYAWFWFFLSSGGVLDSFSQPNVLPKPSKITVNCPKSFILTSSSILTCPKSAEWLLTIRCSKCAKWPVWKSMYLKSWRSQKHKTWTLGKPHSKCSIKSSA